MRFRDDTRGVTVQIGAVLLFATIIIALSVYQATVVPAQNADIEQRHSQEVQSDMVGVRNAILSVAATGSTEPASVDLGTTYPSRVFLMNPPPSSGTVRTAAYDNGTVRLSNVNATAPETRDFIDGSWSASTNYLAYEPDYWEYESAPTLLYEASLLSNYFPDVDDGTAVPLTEQLLVDNETRTITLVSLNGSLSTSRSTAVSVNPEALSAPSQRVQVQPENPGQPVTLSVPSRASAATLRNSTALGDHPGVVSVTDHPTQDDRVVIEVDWDGPFTLRTAKVGVGSDATNPPPHYLTVTEDDGDAVTLQVRDRFNNPESGVEVSVADNESVVAGDVAKRTGTDGEVTFRPAEGQFGPVQFEIRGGTQAREVVSAELGDGPFAVQWDTTAIESQSGVEYHRGNDTVLVNDPPAGSSISMTANVTTATGNGVSGVLLDYSTVNDTVAEFPTSDEDTGSDGRSTVSMSVPAIGETTVHVSGASATDSVGVKVDREGPNIRARVDDLTRQRNNQPVFIASYDVSNTDSDFQRVRVRFETQGGGSGTRTSSFTRAGIRFDGGFGAGAEYDIVFEVIYTDASGDEYVAESTTIQDVADTRNPGGNADLGTGGTASFTSWELEDQTRVNNDQVRYGYSYDVTGSGSFSEVRAFALNVNGNGATTVVTRTSRNQRNQNIQPGDGAGTEYLIGLVIRDANGTVVDVVRIEDVADGNGTYSGT